MDGGRAGRQKRGRRRGGGVMAGRRVHVLPCWGCGGLCVVSARQ